MKKSILLFILSLFSAQGFSAGCPDGNEPIKTISADGTYFVYKCGLTVLDAPKAEFYQRQYDMNSKVDQILSNRKTINPFLAWNYRKAFSGNYYGIAWTGGSSGRLLSNNMLEFKEIYWNYYYVGKSWNYWKDHTMQKTFVTNIDWDHDSEYGVTKAMNIIDSAFPKAFAEEAHPVSKEGLHGVMLDWWHIHHPVPWRGTKLENAMIRMTDEVKKQVGDDFLILGNTNWRKNSKLVGSLNGVFSELYKTPYSRSDSFSFAEIAEMEELIKFNEKHLRYPKLIAFEPWRITDKSDPYNRTSEDNLRFARLYTAMATVIPEHGYILYGDNNQDFDDGDHDHHYYDVYSVDLGKPVSKYTPIANGVAYKKFEDGYIAFNRLEYDVTVNFGDFEVIIPSMDAVFLNLDGTKYICPKGFISKKDHCSKEDVTDDYENYNYKVKLSNNDPIVSKVVEVIRGDKFIVNIAEPHELAGTDIQLFLRDVVTPEVNRHCEKKRKFGKKVRDIVAQRLNNASSIRLTSIKKTSTGVIANIILDDKLDLGIYLLVNELGSNDLGEWVNKLCPDKLGG